MTQIASWAQSYLFFGLRLSLDVGFYPNVEPNPLAARRLKIPKYVQFGLCQYSRL